MSEVDPVAFQKAIETCPEVESKYVELCVLAINNNYKELKKKNEEDIDFELLIEKALKRYDLDNLFEQEPYKSAIGHYYAERQALKRAEKKKQEELVGKIIAADTNSATVRASRSVEICFKALRPHGRLSYLDVDTGKERKIVYGNSRFVEEDEYLAAKRKALAVMNSRRT